MGAGARLGAGTILGMGAGDRMGMGSGDRLGMGAGDRLGMGVGRLEVGVDWGLGRGIYCG